MINTDFFCLPTIIGSMPHRDAETAYAQITHYLKDIPVWPQLPKRSPLENMYIQYSEGFPGIVIEDDSLRIKDFLYLISHQIKNRLDVQLRG